MNYVLGAALVPRGVCRLENLDNVEDWAEMQNGVRQKAFAADACFQMSDDFPKDVKLVDVLFNTNRFLLGSESFVELLRKLKALEQNDIHQVAIVNHKGRREKAPYFIVHQYNYPKCVDRRSTVGVPSKIDPEEYIALTTLVLDESRIDPKLAIFRPREWNKRPFFRRDVSEKITAAGVTGLEFTEIDQVKRF